ncbi:MAG: hypothetical protein HKN11_15955 [Rhizobiales bacterium]|nr:hypothetical protein [Hyphomicrobiales bacterium]
MRIIVPAMTDLAALIERRIVQLFPQGEHAEVRRLLCEDCGASLPGLSGSSPRSHERIQCAALKLSQGRLDKLYDAIALAQTDWRDLLVAAGFAGHPDAHKDWDP